MTSYTLDDLDPNTPVIVGVGQSAERIDDSGYRALSPVDLAAEAVRLALADTDTDPATIAAAVDTVAGTRQFETSSPGAKAPLGRANNYPRAVANRVGAKPGRAILEVGGGQSPQHLITELSASISAGHTRVALVFGSEAISTARHLAGHDDAPDHNEHVEGDLEDRGFGLAGLVSMMQTSHGLVDAPSQYALFENARRSRLKMSRDEYALDMGRLFEPFTKVAAANPFSAAPTRRTAVELATATDRNRPIAEPYNRYVVARDQVNQGAAVLLMSISAARQLGIPEHRWVFLHGHADLRERNLLDREDLSRSPAAVMAARHALDIAGVTVSDIASFDLYSCFPIAVSNVADGLGIDADDDRGLTLTGGLPFFGGPGNNYSMHGIAETIHRCRTHPGDVGFVGANGGTLSKYSVGVYSTTPAPWRNDDSAELQAAINSWKPVPIADHPEGWARVETWTVKHAKDGRRTAVVIGRLEETDERFIAMGIDGDDDILELLTSAQPAGEPIYVRAVGYGNRVTTTKSRMDDLLPVRVTGFRESYEFIKVDREDHLLIVTLNRPEARNALHPPAHEELDEVFDAYFADPDLWVAIITGAGTDAFCSGNDLVYSAQGKPMYIPVSGFGGLTSRPTLPKPIIAAINGYAMGGGLEIALTCHLTVVDEKAQLALSEVRVGLVAGAGGVVRLPRQIPTKVATEMILSGRRMGAQEALDRGLANRIAPTGQALAAARELADEILSGSPTSVRVSLQVMEETAGIADTVAAVTHHSAALDELMVSQDMVEGLSAFATKRTPQWVNR